MCIKCMQIMLPVSESETWEEAQMEWKDTKREFDVDTHCICGVHITSRYLLENQKNGKCFWVGYVCVDSVFKLNTELIDSVNKYTCPYCKTSISIKSRTQHDKGKRHLELVEKYKEFRQCEKCSELKIKKSEPSYKNKCLECFTGKKKCSDCGKYKINGTYKRCFDCYNKN